MRMGWLPSRCIASFAAGKRYCSNSAQHALTKASLTGQQVQHLRLEKPALLLLSEAERLLRERQIDLLLLDLLLPDGSGFDVSSVLTSGGKRGLGLQGIQDRLEAVGGTFEIISAPGKGTELRATIPLET